MQDTLAKRISKRISLTDEERQSLVALFGADCQQKTKNMLWYASEYVPDIPCYGIYDRVTFRDGKASYCAGQSYPDEIRLVRKLLLGR